MLTFTQSLLLSLLPACPRNDTCARAGVSRQHDSIFMNMCQDERDLFWQLYCWHSAPAVDVMHP